MKILFAHPRFPGQFGLLGRWLHARHGVEVRFLHAGERGFRDPWKVYGYPGAAPNPGLRGAGLTFEKADRHGLAAARVLRGMIEAGERPDLIVFHSGFGIGRYLGEVTDIPRIGLFEWYPDPVKARTPARPRTAWTRGRRLTAYGDAAGVLLDLLYCDAAWTSAANQRAQFPHDLQHRLRVIPDAYDAALFHPAPEDSRRVGNLILPDDRPIVSFTSRGLEDERGFDVFMDVAARVQRLRPDTLFVVIGGDEHIYGPEPEHDHPTYREALAARFPGDVSQIWFHGLVSPRDLVRLYRLTTVHTYLSDPYVLSWSPRNAMACGALMVAADHAASRDLMEDGQTALLAPQTDPQALAERVVEGIERHAELAPLRERAARFVQQTSDIEVVGPQIAAWFRQVAGTER